MNKSLKARRFCVRLADNDFDRLNEIADREGFCASAVVRHLILRFIENRHIAGGVQ